MENAIQLPEILFDDDVFYCIKNILKTSDPSVGVHIVTPYVKLDTRTKDAFEEACDKNVRIVMLIRADADHPIDDINWLIRKRIVLKKVEKLHAKVYIGANVALVASMNLHSFSGQESKEVGVLFKDDGSVKRLRDRVNKWESGASEVDPVGLATNAPTADRKVTKVVESESKQGPASTKGHCIRCGASKSFNPKYPLCDICYPIWAKYKDETYEEKCCHRCGAKYATSVKAPLCKPCWSATR